MSNKTTLQSHNTTITNNNITIDDILETINNLPEAGSGEPTLQEKTVSPTTSKQTVKPDTGYDGLSQVTVNAMTTATQATPSITVSSSGLITASATQTAGYVSAGTKSATKQLTTKAATTFTPTTSNQTIASGTYLTGTQTIKGDSNLVAANIKSGVSIFGVAGSVVEGITPSGELAITENGTYDVTNYASANVNVASSGGSGGSIKTTNFNLIDYTWWNVNQTEPSWTLTLTRYIDGQFSIITGEKSSLEEQYGDEWGWISNVVVGSTVIIKDNTGDWSPDSYVTDIETWERVFTGVIIDGKGHLIVHENGEHAVEASYN